MKKMLAVLFLLVAMTCASSAQTTTYVFKRYTAQNATGYTASAQLATGTPTAVSTYFVGQDAFLPKSYTITVTPTGSPATCTYRVFGTVKVAKDNPTAPTDFVGGQLGSDIDCTTKTTIHVVNKPYMSVIGQLATLTGGTSPTVQLEIIATN